MIWGWERFSKGHWLGALSWWEEGGGCGTDIPSGGPGCLPGEAPLRGPGIWCVCSSDMRPHAVPASPRSLRPPYASLLQTSEEIFQHLQNIVDFSKNVMKEFLGENYVHCGVSDFDLQSLNSQASSVSVMLGLGGRLDLSAS